MKAVRFHEYGDAGVLVHEEAPEPVPDASEVRIRVAATSFNGVDAGIRSGALRGPIPVLLPHTPGLDVAGTVDALGGGVDSVAIGDRVVGLLPMAGPGASAEYVIAPAAVLARAPRSIPLTDSAALPLAGLTAWQALFDHGGLGSGPGGLGAGAGRLGAGAGGVGAGAGGVGAGRGGPGSGPRVLVNGAGGGVGNFAVQLAKAAGAHVIATAGPRSEAAVRGAGADEVIDHTAAEVTTDPVDLVLNLAPVGPARLDALLALVRPGGTLVNTTVWLSAPSDPARGVRGVDLFVRGDAAQLTRLVAMVDRGELRVGVTAHVPLADLPSVHDLAARGALSGKVVVVVPPRAG